MQFYNAFETVPCILYIWLFSVTEFVTENKNKKVSSTTVQNRSQEKYYLFTLFCIIGRLPF